jgi:hypothetical protein
MTMNCVVLHSYFMLSMLLSLLVTADALIANEASSRATTRRVWNFRMSSAPITYKQVTLKAPKAVR